jgi:3-oxoacyl-(acyl-carrier-protein) synthase
MINERRVVITGLGAITPLGNDVETFWSNLKNGVSGIHRIEAFDTAAYECKIGGEVRGFDPKAFFKNPKDVRRTDRFAQLALAAAKMALDDSGIDMCVSKQWNRRTENTARPVNDPVDQRTVTNFALHDSDVDQQHGQRTHLNGVRPAGS